MSKLHTLRRRLVARLYDRSRRGVIWVLSCLIVLPLAFAFAAFAIDLGFIVLTGQQLQNAADAACLAAVLELKTSETGMTRDEIKAAAIAQAKAVAAMNVAATRSVILEDADITFYNRSYDSESGLWVTTSEEEGGDNLALNAVAVTIKFDQGGGPRRKLDLTFARTLGITTANVDGTSKSHLTPRDLVFVIDVSGSMFGQSGGNIGGTDGKTILKLFLENIYPTAINYSPQYPYSLLPGAGANDATRQFFPGQYPQRSFPPTLRGNYAALWAACFTDTPIKTTPVPDPNLGTTAIDKVYDGSGQQILLDVGVSAFGTSGQRDQFLSQEFGSTSNNSNHWKWQAFCDFAYSTTSRSSKYDHIYEGTNGHATNLNVLLAPRNTITVKLTDGTATEEWAILGPQMYAKFCVWNGYIPAVKGQGHYVRDFNSDDAIDEAPASNPNYPQPTYPGQYPRTMDIDGFNKGGLYAGGVFTGIYPGDIHAKPMSFVRRATLFGINAMIEQEQSSEGSQVAFNQVGFVSFGTMGFNDLALTNNLDDALRVGLSRITAYPGQVDIALQGPGRTNIGSGIRYAIDILTVGPRSRSFASKSMVVLTDGQANYAPNGGPAAPEFIGTTFNLHESNNDANDYARYWAEQSSANDILVHTVSFNLNDANAKTLLKDVADIGDGLYFDLPGTEAGFEELKRLFVDIAKDKLGKLYLE